MDDQEVAVNISPGELLVWRGLKGISILLLAFMIRLGRETGEGELSTLLKIDRKTIRAHLQSLSAINFVARAGLRDGWTVTAAGRQLVLSLNLALEDGMAALGNGENFPSRKNGNGENLPIQGGGEGRISPLAQSLEESSLLTNQLKDSVLLDSEAGKLADILAAGRELLGEPLMTKCTDANLILGSIAQAWDKREKLRAQGSGFLARVATINIRKGQVEEKYCKAPLKFLPDGFVRRAGLALTPAPLPSSGEGEEDKPEMEPEPPDDSVLGLTPGGHLTFLDAWRAAVGQLQMEMPKAAFDSWVRNTWLAEVRPGPVFVAAVENAYAAEWLTSRLASTCRRLLTGICNQEADIRFEVVHELR